jgi:hypothetical protein
VDKTKSRSQLFFTKTGMMQWEEKGRKNVESSSTISTSLAPVPPLPTSVTTTTAAVRSACCPGRMYQ